MKWRMNLIIVKRYGDTENIQKDISPGFPKQLIRIIKLNLICQGNDVASKYIIVD